MGERDHDPALEHLRLGRRLTIVGGNGERPALDRALLGGPSTSPLSVIVMPNPNATASLRVEVLLNGKRIAIAGVNSFGVISAGVTWARRNPADVTAKMRADKEFNEGDFLREICELDITGLDAVKDKHVSWAHGILQPGNEVTVRILAAGPFDPPLSGDNDA